MEQLRVLLAGGGTAGHVNPLLATANELRARGHEVTVVGTKEGMEAEFVPEAGFELEVIPRVPFPRRPNLEALRFPVRFPRAVKKSEEILRRTGAQVAVGFGGYASTPIYQAASKLGIPVVIHEQNALPGMANKFGARKAAAVALTFPSTPLRARRGQTVTVGLPLREAVADLARDLDRPSRRRVAAAQLGLDPELPTLLVTGGSLGAQHVNEVLAEAAKDIDGLGVQVLHLTGKGKDEPVRAATHALTHYHVLDYLNEMDRAYAAADLVICRAGAGTVAEVSALGVPAIFVPLAVCNGEQAKNAADVVAAGGAMLVENDEFDSRAARIAAELTKNPQRLSEMSEASRQVSPPDGAARLADLIENVGEQAR